MPNVSVTLPETTESVSRPIVYDIIDQISKVTKINKNNKIFFPGDTNVMHTNGSTIDSKDERYAIFDTNYITHIEVTEDYNEDNIASTATSRPEQLPVFVDSSLGIRITPVYVSSDVTIDFKYSCPSKTEAYRWRDDIRMRVSQMRDVNLHDLSYHYLLPLELLVLLKLIHSTRENVAGYDDTLEQYITSRSTDRLTVIGDLVGRDARLGISENQVRVIGLYGWDAVPEKPERQDSGVWVMNFSYKFTYDKPIACNMKYPIMVHNQLLPIYYTYFTDKSYDIDKVDKSYRRSLDALSAFESDTIINSRIDPNAVITIPEIDDFVVKNYPTGTGTIFTALCEIDLTDFTSLLNLKELGDVILDQDILQFIVESEYPYITKTYKSILNLSLYRNDRLTDNYTLACDSSLNVSSIATLDPRNQHRVRLSVVSDLSLLDPKAIERLRKYPKALYKVITAINRIFRNNVDFRKIYNANRVSVNDFSIIYSLLTGYGYANGNSSPIVNGRLPANSLSIFDKTLIDKYRQQNIKQNSVLQSAIIAARQT